MNSHAQARRAFRQLLHVANRLVEPHRNEAFIVLDLRFLFAMDLGQVWFVAQPPVLWQRATIGRREFVVSQMHRWRCTGNIHMVIALWKLCALNGI